MNRIYKTFCKWSLLLLCLISGGIGCGSGNQGSLKQAETPSQANASDSDGKKKNSNLKIEDTAIWDALNSGDRCQISYAFHFLSREGYDFGQHSVDMDDKDKTIQVARNAAEKLKSILKSPTEIEQFDAKYIKHSCMLSPFSNWKEEK